MFATVPTLAAKRLTVIHKKEVCSDQKTGYRYKHITSHPPEGLQRSATLWRPVDPQRLGGKEVGCRMGLQGASIGYSFIP